MSSQPQFKIKKKRKFSDLSKSEKYSIMFQILIIFLVFASIIYFTGFVPNELKSSQKEDDIEIFDPVDNIDTQDEEYSKDNEVSTYTRPTHISIDKIGVNSVIETPNSPNIDVLDQSLQKGAVHYPGSGSIEQGNIFIFGHSTNWKIVKNQAYKTFNGLENLEPGDEIVLESDGEKYVYVVDNVTLANESEALVDLNTTEQKLTISTCNSFGEKQERWVVEAYRV